MLPPAAHNSAPEKRCTKCLVVKPLEEFFRYAKLKDGRRPDCKKCASLPARVVSIEDRFWSKVDKSGDCWLWLGSVNTNNGYGRFWIGSGLSHTIAHRFAWTLKNGDAPDGMLLCHECDNPACVNPDHLFVGTSHDNIVDSIRKGRYTPSKLTVDDIPKIRNLLREGDMTYGDIGNMFGVSGDAVGHINRGSTWGWLE